MELNQLILVVINCRIGSLEIFYYKNACDAIINCRIGSLERKILINMMKLMINCRIGSLEKKTDLRTFYSALTAE